MSADSARISRKSDFTRTLSKGVRVSARSLTVHVAPVPRSWPDPSDIRTDAAMRGGPWLGLIISKRVGNAVVRHRTARRLRQAFRETAPSMLPTESFVVLRAHPGVVDMSTSDMADALRDAFGRGKVRAAVTASGAVESA